jgi:hypothetical protein
VVIGISFLVEVWMGEGCVAAANATAVQDKCHRVLHSGVVGIGNVTDTVADTAQKVVAIMQRKQRSGAGDEIELIVGERERHGSMSGDKNEQHEREYAGHDEATKEQTDRGAVGHI